MPPKIYDAKKAKRAKNAKNANLLQGANAQSATTKAYSTTMGWAKKGGRRWSPPGGYNQIKNHNKTGAWAVDREFEFIESPRGGPPPPTLFCFGHGGRISLCGRALRDAP